MPDEKMTKEKLLARRAQAAGGSAIDEHLRRHPWMTRAEVEEHFRVLALSPEEQTAYHALQAKTQLKESLLSVEGVDAAMAERLTDGGVRYFHSIASSLPYEQFHEIAHRMIGVPAAGC